MLKEIHVTDFKLLHDFTAQFTGLDVIIGANACGKTTAIDLLRFIRDAMNLSLSDALTNVGGQYHVANKVSQNRKFTLSCVLGQGDMSRNWEAVLPKTDVRYSCTIDLSASLGPSAESESLTSVQPFKGHDDVMKYLLANRKGTGLYNTKTHKLEPFNEVQSSSSAQKGMTVPNVESGLLLSKMRFYNEYPVPSWCQSYFSWMCFYGNFQTGRESLVRTLASEINRNAVLIQDGSNVGSVLHELLTRSEFSEKADTFRNYLRLAYPFIDNIFAETSHTEPRVLVRFREHGISSTIELSEVSDGVLRFICLAACLLGSDTAALVAIDEPELGFHPRVMPILGELIKAAAENVQVMIITHSPELLDSFSLSQIAVMRRTSESVVTWDRPDKSASLRKLLSDVEGETIGALHRSGELEF